jgi:hypothetical protein
MVWRLSLHGAPFGAFAPVTFAPDVTADLLTAPKALH